MTVFHTLLEARLSGDYEGAEQSLLEADDDKAKLALHLNLARAHAGRAPHAGVLGGYHRWRAGRNLKKASKHLYRVRKADAIASYEKETSHGG